MSVQKKKLLLIGLDGAIPGVLRKFLKEGILPNFASIMKGGSFVEVLPSPPCDTPTNWTTIVTGAWTGTHGATGFNVHLPGESLSAPVSCSFDTRLCGAEYLWNVAEREGFKCLLYDYPPSRPPTLKNGIVLGGWFTEKKVGGGVGTFHGNEFEQQPPFPERIADILKDAEDILRTEQPAPKGFEGKIADVLDSQEMSLKRFVKTISFLKEREEWDYLFCHLHVFDGFHHYAMNDLWEDHPDYIEERGDKTWEAMRILYKLADEMLGEVIDRFSDEETIICVIGDHGATPSSRIIWPGKALERAGLTVFKEGEAGDMVIDVSRSKVGFYFSPPEYIWVNLKGREPGGIVEPGDEYEKVRAQVIAALMSVRDPINGKCPFSLVLRKEDAGFLGQWGPRVGDIVLFVEPEYSLVDFGFGSAYGSNIVGGVRELLEMGDLSPRAGGNTRHGNHHGHLPTAKLGIFSNSSFMLIKGEGIRQGLELKHPRQMVDVAPTLSSALGIPKPTQAEGGIIWQVLE